ncbi:MAG: NAD-dependent epimerase, partial [Akkermansiaceae bacterium]|nr:NAD-dependent epimerase [Akkermansiaceae bacterium]
GWPVRISAGRAEAMGFEADSSLEEIIRIFIEDDLGGEIVA